MTTNKELISFEKGRAKVLTRSEAYGYIDTKGKLLIDTLYNYIGPFVNGLAVVKGIHDQPYTNEEEGLVERHEVGVIDSLGKWIVPYGQFEDITDFEAGYAEAIVLEDDSITDREQGHLQAILDRNGKTVWQQRYRSWYCIGGNVHDGMVKVYLSIKKDQDYSSENSYEGFINLKGERIIDDTLHKSAEDFSNNRAFVQAADDSYSIIDTKGHKVGSATYDDIIPPGFHKGSAFVEVDGLWGLIDTNAQYIIAPSYEEVQVETAYKDYFFFGVKDTLRGETEYGDDYFLYGVAGMDGKVKIKPIIQDFNPLGFVNGLLPCVIKDKDCYINAEGTIVWEEDRKKNKGNELRTTNVTTMQRAYFYASSQPHKSDIGGFGSSSNWPKAINKKNHFAPKRLSVWVDANNADTLYETYKAYTVYVANRTSRKQEFDASDSRLEMWVQALDKNGQWRDIEYIPRSWCGNSYHILTLPKKTYWEFMTPVYEGDFKTKLRIALSHKDPKSKENENKQITIYSNTYEGSVNPGQFWRKEGHVPNNIMDPYNE